jgi:hypothetical protein
MSGKKYENGCFLKPQLLTDRKRPNISVIFCRILPVFTGLKSFFRPAGPDRSENSGPVPTLKWTKNEDERKKFSYPCNKLILSVPIKEYFITLTTKQENDVRTHP